MIKLENSDNTKCWQGCRETRSLKHCTGSVTRYLHSGEKKKKNQLAQMEKNLPEMQETKIQSLGWEDPLEKGMATHFSILA